MNDLMSSPAVRGLFVRAIVQSGLGRERTQSLAAAEQDGAAFATKLGLQDTTASTLRKLTADQILKAGSPDILAGWGPMIDGTILSMKPQDAFASGLEANVPYIVGFNSLEYPVPEADLNKVLDRIIPSDQRANLSAAYPDQASYRTHVASDLLFNEPALNLARLHASNGQPTWLYEFSVTSPAIRGTLPGAPHASDRQYVFKTLASSPWKTDANDVAQADLMSAYWCAFARQGDPNGDGRTVWPRYSAADDELLNFTDSGPESAKVPRRPAINAIPALYR